MNEYEHKDLTEKIIGCFYRVYNVLGYGFLEKVYENAMAIEFKKAGLKFGKQVGLQVLYEKEVVGDYIADFVVGGKVIVEVKASSRISGADKAQLINYLKATGIGVGLLVNFGKESEVKRVFWGEKNGK
jgi:GxxExxY protein